MMDTVEALDPERYARGGMGRRNAIGTAERLVRAGRDDAAVAVLRRPARQGHPVACYALGHLLFFGDARVRRPDEGVAWLQSAARAGQANAIADLARLRPSRDGFAFEAIPASTKRLQRLLRAARGGAAEAQHALAGAYATGHGVAEDRAWARYWYDRAARSGLSAAMYTVGMMWLEGNGGERDVRQAKAWLEACAAGGAPNWPQAMFAAELVSAIYAGEHGEPLRDLDASARWQREAERIETRVEGLDD